MEFYKSLLIFCRLDHFHLKQFQKFHCRSLNFQLFLNPINYLNFLILALYFKLLIKTSHFLKLPNYQAESHFSKKIVIYNVSDYLISLDHYFLRPKYFISWIYWSNHFYEPRRVIFYKKLSQLQNFHPNLFHKQAIN